MCASFSLLRRRCDEKTTSFSSYLIGHTRTEYGWAEFKNVRIGMNNETTVFMK